jgi:hypothetical protein
VLGTSLGAEEVESPVPLPVHPAIESTAANRVSERRTWRRIWARVFRRSTNTPLIGDQSVTWFTGEAKQEDLEFLAGLLDSGEVVPVNENTRPLEKTPDALAIWGRGTLWASW